MKWFGENWGSPALKTDEQCPAPVGEKCGLCGSGIVIGDQGVLLAGGTSRIPYHIECLQELMAPEVQTKPVMSGLHHKAFKDDSRNPPKPNLLENTLKDYPEAQKTIEENPAKNYSKENDLPEEGPARNTSLLRKCFKDVPEKHQGTVQEDSAKRNTFKENSGRNFVNLILEGMTSLSGNMGFERNSRKEDFVNLSFEGITLENPLSGNMGFERSP